MLQSLNIEPSADGGTLRFELNGGGVMMHASVFAARSRGGAVDICYRADNEVLFSVMPQNITLAGGAPFADAASAVTALNAVIGAGFRSAGGTAAPTPPDVDLSGYYTRTQVDNAIGAEAQERTQGDAAALAAASEYADSKIGTLIVRTVPQTPSPQAGVQYYNHFIWTPAVSGTDGTWSVVQNQAINRLAGELFCLGVYATSAGVGITLAMKKVGTSWFLAGVSGFIYRSAASNASVKINIGFELKADGSQTGYANQWAFYEINQTNVYPRMLNAMSGSAYDVALSTSGGANVQFFCVNNIQP